MLDYRGGQATSWADFDPFHLLGVKPDAAVNGPAPMTGLAASAGPTVATAGVSKPWHPDSPLFWLGALAAVTLGFIGASTSIRVGPFKAAVAAGKS